MDKYSFYHPKKCKNSIVQNPKIINEIRVHYLKKNLEIWRLVLNHWCIAYEKQTNAKKSKKKKRCCHSTNKLLTLRVLAGYKYTTRKKMFFHWSAHLAKVADGICHTHQQRLDCLFQKRSHYCGISFLAIILHKR